MLSKVPCSGNIVQVFFSVYYYYCQYFGTLGVIRYNSTQSHAFALSCKEYMRL